MGKEQDGERPVYQVLQTRTITLISVIVVAVGVGLAIWLLRAYGQGNPGDSTRLDAIKTAGGIVIGSGGAVALWLAARRQRTTEIALKQKDRDQDHAEKDATERRVTELYTKAADQLGSDKAPVRLAGMYALERLAQNTPDQRQTIVNVLCAYLRMPYLPGESSAQHSPIRPREPASVQDSTSSVEPAAPEAVTVQWEQDDQREQERQVRLTAQRILASHLRPGDPAQPAATFWADIDLDLTGATLLDFNFAGCHLRTAHFTQARFSGTAGFENVRVLMDVSDGVARTWLPGYSLTAPATPEKGKLEGNKGSWGYLMGATGSVVLADSVPAPHPPEFRRRAVELARQGDKRSLRWPRIWVSASLSAYT